MSTIKSSDEHLTLNADGSSKDIKFQANGVEKASISSAGAFTSTTIDATKLTGNLPAISGASLTGLPADATKAPLANPTFTGTVSKSGSSSGTAKIFKTASDASEIYLYIGTGATKFRKQDDSANTFEILPDGRGKSQFTAKAWISFKGTGTVSIHESHNVSSLGDNGTGKQRVNFANNMSSANYSVSGTARRNSRVFSESDDHNRVTNYVDTCVAQSWTASGEDQEVVSVLVFGE